MNEPVLPSYQSARFLTSAQHLGQCPPESGCEIAFAGRSNAGKSSAINAITRNGGLARSSKTPGRTQLINFFSLNKADCRLVDLPGYGYAKVSKELQERWQRDLHQYLEQRLCLHALILVMDIRHPLTPLDSQLVSWCSKRRLPTLILLTKSDKLSRNAARQTQLQVEKQLKGKPGHFKTALFSATGKIGIEAAQAFMDEFFAPIGQQSSELTNPTEPGADNAPDAP
ncbi:MAG: YihA family ribosome biogenesis GTP-binding protein [Hahellaceae bacterium]|jgi:GTP-binding protein|nr:YihA family ribosome biogenesis GTP-binding protein [Hahellaceae bacterium]